MEDSNKEQDLASVLNSDTQRAHIRALFARRALEITSERFGACDVIQEILFYLETNSAYYDKIAFDVIIQLLETKELQWLRENLKPIFEGTVIYHARTNETMDRHEQLLRELFVEIPHECSLDRLLVGCIEGPQYKELCQVSQNLEEDVLLHAIKFPEPYGKAERLISKAAYKIVVKIKDKYKDEYKAGKVVDIEDLGKEHLKQAGYTTLEECIRAEYIKMERLQSLRHPNICTIHHLPMRIACGRKDIIVFVEEYCHWTLEQEITRKRKNCTKWIENINSLYDLIIRYSMQITSALAACHDQEILHEDLKPSNVMIQQVQGPNLVKLTDFGYANCQGSITTMAPEVAAGRAQTKRSNVFSVGAMMYWMLTGVIPFAPRDKNGDIIKKPSGEDMEERNAYEEEVKKNVQNPHNYYRVFSRLKQSSHGTPAAPTHLVMMIMKAMSYDPKQRYADAGEMFEDFKRAGYNEENYKRSIVDLQERIDIYDAAKTTLTEEQKQKLAKILGVSETSKK